MNSAQICLEKGEGVLEKYFVAKFPSQPAVQQILIEGCHFFGTVHIFRNISAVKVRAESHAVVCSQFQEVGQMEKQVFAGGISAVP